MKFQKSIKKVGHGWKGAGHKAHGHNGARTKRRKPLLKNINILVKNTTSLKIQKIKKTRLIDK
jgi:hypothetical protein